MLRVDEEDGKKCLEASRCGVEEEKIKLKDRITS